MVSYSVKKRRKRRSQSVCRPGLRTDMFPRLCRNLCAVQTVSVGFCRQVTWTRRRWDLLVAGWTFSLYAARALLIPLEARARLWWSTLCVRSHGAVLLHTVDVPRLRQVLIPFRWFCPCATRLWGPEWTMLTLALQITVSFIINTIQRNVWKWWEMPIGNSQWDFKCLLYPSISQKYQYINQKEDALEIIIMY